MKFILILRIVTYNESTRPIIQLYEKENLVKRIDASDDVNKVSLNSNFIFLLNLSNFRYLQMFKMY
jgi:hypothetical protein